MKKQLSATSETELWQLAQAARRHGRKVSICHVLRYTPFYAAIRQEVLKGTIGDLLNVQAVEHVSYHHQAVGFVRGKWNRRDASGSSMLMAKSCHDLDLIAWMKSGVPPVRVASFGGNYLFRPEKAPAGAGTRCLVDCPIEADCLYSARKQYLDHPDRWCCFEDSRFVIRRPDPRPGHEYAEETVDLRINADMTGAHGGHGGGDLRLVADFLCTLRGEPPSISATSLEDSISGHLMGFCADRAMAEGVTVALERDSRRDLKPELKPET